MGIFAGLGTYVSQCYGRGDKKECTSYFWQAVYMGTAFSLLILAICWPLAPAIFRSFGHEPEVVELEVIYFRIMLFGNIAVVFVWAGVQFFMGIHRPVLSMYAALDCAGRKSRYELRADFRQVRFPGDGNRGFGLGDGNRHRGRRRDKNGDVS